MIKWDERGKLPVSHPELAYESSMISSFDHPFEIACLNKSSEREQLETSQLYFIITTHLLFFDQSPCIPRSTCACSPPDTMYVLAHIHGRIIVDYMRHMFDVYPPRYEVGTDEPMDLSITVKLDTMMIALTCRSPGL
jgi:hypothetical protein